MRQIIIAIGTLKFAGLEFPLRVYGYGLMLVLGFIVSILLAQWRTRREGENPEVISQLAILALLGGVGGARLAYIIKEWDHFRLAGLGEIFNISSGGLIYFGGLLGGAGLVVIGMLLKRLPLRRFLDIFAPTIMVGLAFGRMGCLLNGCCWGGPCDAQWPLAMRFPMVSKPLILLEGKGPYVDGQSLSPIYSEQYYTGLVTPDGRLLNSYLDVSGTTPTGKRIFLKAPLPVEQLHGRLAGDQLVTIFATEAEAHKAFLVLAGGDGRIDQAEWERGREQGDGFLRGSEVWDEAIYYPKSPFDTNLSGPISFEGAWRYLQARKQKLLQQFDADGDDKLDDDERRQANAYLQADLYALLGHERTNPQRPAQVLGIINALLLGGLLLLYHRHRRREGRVFALMLILYPITRFLLESIRNVDPFNVFHGNWTHNQISALVLILMGAVMWWWIGRLPVSAGPTLADRLADKT